MKTSIPLGVVVADIEGTGLTDADRAHLMHPQVGGVILFSRNFESLAQICRLCDAIRELRDPPLLIAVDHEGGRVQRFRDGFTLIPPMRTLGALWDRDEDAALAASRDCGFVLASELTACGVNLSFTPVLDVDSGASGVIGDRAFHSDPDAIAALAAALQHGLAEGGLAACGKHFPGHGHVRADSHHAVPVDERPLAAIESCDLIPFQRLIAAGLAAVMPAHVIYPRIDSLPAGFSPTWLKDILRGQYHFDGLIFSDDLSMEGAKVAGGVVARAYAALQAGCDMVLLCNDVPSSLQLVAGLAALDVKPVSATRVDRLRRPRAAASRSELQRLPRYVQSLATLSGLVERTREG